MDWNTLAVCGCKHPRNWAEKRSNEHDTMLGEMVTDMVIEMSFSKEDLKRVIETCKHMVGLDRKNPYHRHGKAFYKPYRNYFAANKSGDRLLDKLPHWIICKERSENRIWYTLTSDGLGWLGNELGIKIYGEKR